MVRNRCCHTEKEYPTMDTAKLNLLSRWSKGWTMLGKASHSPTRSSACTHTMCWDCSFHHPVRVQLSLGKVILPLTCLNVRMVSSGFAPTWCSHLGHSAFTPGWAWAQYAPLIYTAEHLTSPMLEWAVNQICTQWCLGTSFQRFQVLLLCHC